MKIILNYILEALLDTHHVKERFQLCLQRFCKSHYLNQKEATTTQAATDKSYDCDITEALPQNPPTHTAFAYSITRGSPLFLPRKHILADFMNTWGNTINIADLVYSFTWKQFMYTPQGEERFLSRLQRISREAEKEYLNIAVASVPDIEGDMHYCDTKVSCQKATTQVAFASLTAKKPKATFGDVCESFVPCCKLPGGLLLAQSIYCAKTALEFYNCKHGTEHKLVEPLATSRYMVCGIHFHSNFFAAEIEKNGQCAAQPKLFYADFRTFEKKVCARDMHCCIIDSVKAMFMCCKDCPPELAHCEEHSTKCYSHRNRFFPPEVSKARKNKFCAKAALNFYNKKHGTKYVLVKSLESHIVPINFATYQFSCSFKAKLKKPCGADSSSKRLFFGELVMSSGRTEGSCIIVDGYDSLLSFAASCGRSETLDDNCSNCQSSIRIL